MYRQYYLLTKKELISYLYSLNNEKGMSLKKISETLGCSKATVHRWFKKHNIPIVKNYDTYVPFNRYGFNTIDELYEYLKECRINNINKSQISRNLGCTRQTAIRLINRFHLD